MKLALVSNSHSLQCIDKAQKDFRLLTPANLNSVEHYRHLHQDVLQNCREVFQIVLECKDQQSYFKTTNGGVAELIMPTKLLKFGKHFLKTFSLSRSPSLTVKGSSPGLVIGKIKVVTSRLTTPLKRIECQAVKIHPIFLKAVRLVSHLLNSMHLMGQHSFDQP
jgi:hypothetical protein